MSNGVNEVIIFETSSGVLRFDGAPYGLVSVEGLGDVSADIQTQKSPYQDGVTYIDSVLEPRYISIEFIIRGTDYAEVRNKRAEMSRIVNPKKGLGTIRYVSGDLDREIRAVAETVPFFPDGDNRGERWQRGTISFLCPSPYWTSTQINEEPTFKPMFQFPFEGTFEMGIQRDERIVVNDGDASSPVYIELFGPAVNPIIRNNTTGEFIKINRTLKVGEFLRLDTSPGNKTVEFVAEDGTATNVFNWIDLSSSFFELELGENEIVYSADNDIQGAVVNISYYKRYAGI